MAKLLGCTQEWAPAEPGIPGPPGVGLLSVHPTACDAVAKLLGCDGAWTAAGTQAEAAAAPSGAGLVTRRPATARALESLLASR